MRPEAQRKHVSLTLGAAAAPCLAVDPTRIAQLLGNLISNACLTPGGGRVEIRVGMEGDQAVLAVADTGAYFPPPTGERVFERFFRTTTAARHAIQGTGLGLAVTKAIVDAHSRWTATKGAEAPSRSAPLRHRPVSG